MANVDTPSNPHFRDAYQLIQEANSLKKEHTRRLFQNRPQSWRHLLSRLCGAHFSIAISSLLGDWVVNGLRFAQLNVLNLMAVVVAIATRITWHALFANPYAILGYQRPSASYRLAVYLVSFLITIPTLIVHITIIRVCVKLPSSTSFIRG